MRNRTNVGLPRTLNRAAEEASGRFLARQDADDVSCWNRFGMQVRYLEDNPNAGVVGCWWEWMDKNGETYSSSRPSAATDVMSMLLKGQVPAPHGSLMWRREAFEVLGGYDTRFWFSQDYDLWLRLMHTDWLVGIVEKKLYRLRIAPRRTHHKELCQRRYTELALAQFHARRQIDFGDVSEEIRALHPESDRPLPHAEADYWSEIATSALLSLRDRTLSRRYCRRSLALRWSILALLGLSLTFLPSGLARFCVKFWRGTSERAAV